MSEKLTEKSTEKPNQPAYRAATETAHAELRQISDRLNQLRIRQEQICTAVQALKLLVSVQESSTSARGRVAQSSKEVAKVKALA